MKICGKCGFEKEDFHLNKNNKDGLSCWCKNCTSKNKKEYYQNNKNSLLEKSKIHYQNNKLKKQEYDKKRYQNNKNIRKEYNKLHYKNNKQSYIDRNRKNSNFKYKNDIFFKLKNRISSEINKALIKVNSSKNNHSILEYLPYTIQDLKEHLEKQFEPWMSWNNWGKYNKNWDDNDKSTWTWQIDHIIPQSILIYTSMEDNNFQKCWALNNLRPLNSKENLFDGINRKRHK